MNLTDIANRDLVFGTMKWGFGPNAFQCCKKAAVLAKKRGIYRLRPQNGGINATTFDWGLKKFKPPFEPRYVFLFSGHMIDAPGRMPSRFPANKEMIAAREIEKKLDKLDAVPKDLALCSGACGGDLLFAEACLKLGVHLQVRIPFDEPTFLTNSVTFAGGNWRGRYFAVKNNKLTTLLVMPDELGPTSPKMDPYEQVNLWQLHTALFMGPEKVRFICLWDGKGGDGPGGTKHMYKEVLKRSGKAYVIDTNKL